jgi:ligand-binding SRPBCC domain-containing protein
MLFRVASWIVDLRKRQSTKKHETARTQEEMQFVKESLMRASAERVFAFHELPDALERLMPPWETAKVIQRADISVVGSRAIIETQVVGPIKVRWVAEHTCYEPPHMFEDVQIEGPFRRWRHRHLIDDHPEGTLLRDEIDYEPPFGALGRAVAPLLIDRRLMRLFDYRHRVTREWAERQRMRDEA